MKRCYEVQMERPHCPQYDLQLFAFSVTKMASLTVSTYAEKNGKNYMEDRHFMFKHRNGVFVAGVCDGHGGEFCSDFVARDLPENLSAEMDYHTDHETALRRAIRETDRDLCTRLTGRWKKAGTTAVICMITDSEVIAGWVGDSQAVLVRPNTQGIPLVTVHRCACEKERQRIKQAGGTVTCYKGKFRLNGALSVSRSLGDTEYRPGLTAVPEVTHTPLTGTEEYLVLGSDGFFDHVSLESIRHSVYLSYMRHGGCLDNVSKDLFVRAQNAGAIDNITIMVCFFRKHLSCPYQSEDEVSRVSRLSHLAELDDDDDDEGGSDEDEIDRFLAEVHAMTPEKKPEMTPDQHQSTPPESLPSFAPTCKGITLGQKAATTTPTPKTPVAVHRSFSSVAVSAQSVEYVNPTDCLPAVEFNRPPSGICAPSPTPVRLSQPSPPPVPTNSPHPTTSAPTFRPTVPRFSAYKPRMYDQWQRVPKKIKSSTAHANQTPLPLKKVSIEMASSKPAAKQYAKGSPVLTGNRRYSSVSRDKMPDKTKAKQVASAPLLLMTTKLETTNRPSHQAARPCRKCESCESGRSPVRPCWKVTEAQGSGDEKPKKKKNIIRRALKSGKKRGQEVLEGGRKALKASREVLHAKVTWVGTHINRLGSAVSRKNRVSPLEPG
ncbi:uncharacterized protein LOC118432401 isoform X2 [Branchiostoma floridae]|uniref:protein-serine/threonine phosphatase n=1 Tax=Branchiostoma floridae TaxID=7739 RepID=A0A9J7MHV7_BRAFL|nr:uncharacterized protein LOC118432401 isoform X2 [Branchiostoma floridae]